MRCHYCGWSGGTHSPDCPCSFPFEDLDRATQIWKAGWDCGRSGRECPDGATQTYKLGHHQGEIALEEAQNTVPYSSI